MAIKLTLTGAGQATHSGSVQDRQGSGILPIQAKGDGATTFRVRGRVSPDADWVDIKAAGTADFLESFAWCPHIQLDVTSGSGAVTLWIGDN